MGNGKKLILGCFLLCGISELSYLAARDYFNDSAVHERAESFLEKKKELYQRKERTLERPDKETNPGQVLLDASLQEASEPECVEEYLEEYPGIQKEPPGDSLPVMPTFGETTP